MPNFLQKLFKTEKRNSCVSQDLYNLGLLFNSGYIDAASTHLSAFYSCLELISNSIAELPILVMKGKEVLETHQIYDAFDNSLLFFKLSNLCYFRNSRIHYHDKRNV